MNLEKVIIIIPTYNEETVIKETLLQVFKIIDQIHDFDVRILVFDSASSDKTQHIVIELQNKFNTLYLQTENYRSGLGSAYLKAMHYAVNDLNADIIFEFDADLSHQPFYIIAMLQLIKTCDVVIGSRYISGGSIPKDWGFHRKLLSTLGNYCARLVLTNNYKDFTSGFRATRSTSLMKVLPFKFITSGYAYKLQLLWLLHCFNAKICEYPIEFIDREFGNSKLPKNSIIEALYVIILLRTQSIIKKIYALFVKLET